jgi:FkbM family methyltransferase
MKRHLKSLLKYFGYQIKKVPRYSNSFDRIYSEFLKKESPVIFDIGSHRGESIDRFLRLFPDSRIYGFEPNAENYKTLSFAYGKRDHIVIENFGVGSKNEKLEFHSFKKTDTSSFLNIVEDSIWTQVRKEQLGIQKEESFQKDSYEVEIISIDDYFRKNRLQHIELLKIDTQGFELEVLKGCSYLLENQLIDFIELEIIVHGPYTRDLRFLDIEGFFSNYNYKLYGILQGSNYFDNPILQFDLLFTRQSLYRHNLK